MSNSAYRIHERVDLMHWEDKEVLYTGTVIGTATVVGMDDMSSLSYKLIIRLDDGFWNEKKDIFVSVLCVDADSIRSRE